MPSIGPAGNRGGARLPDHQQLRPTRAAADLRARPFIAALIALDEEGATRWAQTHGRAGTSLQDLASDPQPLREIQRAVDAVNRSLSRAESIRKFVVLARDMRVDTGELTPTLKVRRAVVERTYADEIQSLYGP
jgi:long-chain acyl-CoA synthetase